ncbi:hypothetical protein P9112_006749 [Eukaryota sp. TZLM1-RC]
MSPLSDLFQRENLSMYYEDVLTLLLELRPTDPEVFLHDYFKSATSEHTAIQRAARYISLIFNPTDENSLNDNCVAAYQALSDFVLGDSFNSLLSLLLDPLPSTVSTRALTLLSADSFELVPYERFRSAISSFLSIKRLFENVKLLYQLIEVEDLCHDSVIRELVSWIRDIFYNVNVNNVENRLKKVFNNAKNTNELNYSLDDWLNDISSVVFETINFQ